MAGSTGFEPVIAKVTVWHSRPAELTTRVVLVPVNGIEPLFIGYEPIVFDRWTILAYH